ncbi:MAG: hypothetical protein H0U76_14350 [Ktedonobacteraceae bacterium]|nr:hypothetical protein [Ktedonobacteraceae bacterium]MBA3916456.1 hypothetical protein [Terriglobales bacterium]
MSHTFFKLSMMQKFAQVAFVISINASLVACQKANREADSQIPSEAAKDLDAFKQSVRNSEIVGNEGKSLESSSDALRGRKSFIDEVSSMVTPEKLVAIKGSNGSASSSALLVTYSPSRQASPGEETQPASCSVFIVENVVGTPRIAERNDKMLNCSLLQSVEVARAAISATVDNKNISITDRAARGEEKFDFEKATEVRWLIERVRFVHTENNTESGFVEVVTEEARYAGKNHRLRVSDYYYDAIKADLVRKITK